MSRVLVQTPIIVLLSCSALLAANDKPKTSDNQAPTIKSKAELVLVPAVVTDSKGDHIPDLTKDDFQVFDERHPQEIKLFEEIKTSAQTPQTSIHSSKDEFNNYVNTKSDEPQRLTIIVFDLINMPTLKQSSAKKALLDFLADAASTSEPTAVYSISQKGVSVISDFTTSPKVLAQALQSLKFGTQMKVAGVEPTEHEWLMGGLALRLVLT